MISFNSLVEGFEIIDPEKYKTWLQEIISKQHQKGVGEITFIFVDDAALNEINTTFLKHDTYTDIITFDNSSNVVIISGEIYISIERVAENAKSNMLGFDEELARVIVHGVLHLLGFKDETKEEKAEMRSKEDYCLNLLP